MRSGDIPGVTRAVSDVVARAAVGVVLVLDSHAGNVLHPHHEPARVVVVCMDAAAGPHRADEMAAIVVFVTDMGAVAVRRPRDAARRIVLEAQPPTVRSLDP